MAFVSTCWVPHHSSASFPSSRICSFHPPTPFQALEPAAIYKLQSPSNLHMRFSMHPATSPSSQYLNQEVEESPIAALRRNASPISPERLERIKAAMALILTTHLWCISNVTAKHLMRQGLSPGLISAFRFSLSALLLSPNLRIGMMWPALKLALISFAGNALLALSLARGMASRISFLTSLAVVMVPILSAIFLKEKISRTQVVAISLCAGGASIMCGQNILQVILGISNLSTLTSDLLALVAAMCFGGYTVALSRESVKYDTLALSSAMRFCSGTLAIGWALAERIMKSSVPSIAQVSSAIHKAGPYNMGLLFAMGFLLVGSGLSQVWGQKRIGSPIDASLIYTLQPFWGSVYGYFLLNERLSSQSMAGGLLISLGLIISEITRAKQTKKL